MKKFIAGLGGVLAVLFMARASWAADLIRVDGSSTVFPITEAVAEEFGSAGKGKVMVGISGTGGGFKRFCRGETDISDASRLIKDSEKGLCKSNGIDWIEIPIAYDGLSVVVSKNNTWADHLTVKELKKIWEPEAQGKITNWNQVRSSFPDKELKLFGPGTDSGTFDYFTEAINGKAASSRGDYTASEDDNVLVEGVASEDGGLGYFGLAYYKENSDKLKLVAVDNGKGAVLPSIETVMDGSYKPLARLLYIYVSKAAVKRQIVQQFVGFYLENASSLVEEVGYIPLHAEDYTSGLTHFRGSI